MSELSGVSISVPKHLFIQLKHQVRLVGHGDLALAGGDQLRRCARIGRRDQLDIEAGTLEEAARLGDDERRVVRVDEPVEQHGELVGSLGATGDAERDGECGYDGTEHCGLSDLVQAVFSGAQGVISRVRKSTAARRSTDIAANRRSAANTTSVCERPLAWSIA
jgi:hypothetical protein